MATLARYQSFALDAAGNVLASPTVEVRDELTSSLVPLFSDRAGTSGIGNPFTGASDGLIAFHVVGGAYKITVTSGAVVRTFRYVAISTASEHDTTYDSANNLVPFTDDGAALGTAALKWSDLFLALGSTINWNNGDLILTHSADTLTLTGGNLVITGNYTITGNVAITGNFTLTAGAFAGRIDPRISSAASGDISPDISAADIYIRTALSAGININAPIGTPVQGDKLIFRLKDNATARALTWNAIYRIVGTILPTTTVISKTTYVAVIYNATDTKWDVLAVNTEA